MVVVIVWRQVGVHAPWAEPGHVRLLLIRGRCAHAIQLVPGLTVAGNGSCADRGDAAAQRQLRTALYPKAPGRALGKAGLACFARDPLPASPDPHDSSPAHVLRSGATRVWGHGYPIDHANHA